MALKLYVSVNMEKIPIFKMKLNYDFFLNKFNSVYNNDIRLVDLNNKWWYHNCRVHFAGNQKHSFHIVTRSP